MNDLLSEMLSILSGGSSWTTGANARDSDGDPCPALSVNAVSWDVWGALMLARVNLEHEDWTIANAVYKTLCERTGMVHKNSDPESYNDAATWADMQSLLAPV